MSVRRLLDRRVSIEHRAKTGTNARGNDVVAVTSTDTDVRSARDQISTAEDTGNAREQVSSRYVYFFDRGQALGPLDRIVDGDETFELDGDPDRVTRRRGGREHHVEAIAYRITG